LYLLLFYHALIQFLFIIILSCFDPVSTEIGCKMHSF